MTSPSKKKARTESSPTTSPQLVGLENLGNTCYLNAVMQCLAHTDFALYFFVCDKILLGVLGKEWKKLISNLKISDKKINATKPKALRKINRRKNTNRILMIISIVFFVSWAPLNILNIIINTENPFKVWLF